MAVAALSAVLDHVKLGWPSPVGFVVMAALVFLYPFPLGVSVVRSFRAGLRGDGAVRTGR